MKVKKISYNQGRHIKPYMIWYSWGYLTLLKVKKYISLSWKYKFTKTNVEDFWGSLLSLARNINKHECYMLLTS